MISIMAGRDRREIVSSSSRIDHRVHRVRLTTPGGLGGDEPEMERATLAEEAVAPFRVAEEPDAWPQLDRTVGVDVLRVVRRPKVERDGGQATQGRRLFLEHLEVRVRPEPAEHALDRALDAGNRLAPGIDRGVDVDPEHQGAAVRAGRAQAELAGAVLEAAPAAPAA